MPSATPEEHVLEPRGPSHSQNSDEWPEFKLTDVTVHQPGDSNVLTSLLDATEHFPVTVTGLLEPLSNQLAHLAKNPIIRKRAKRIEIAEVRSFAYGQYADGSVPLWAAGKAGWFVIKPGRAYREVHQRMTEAVNTWYSIVDAYTTPRYQGKGKSRKLLPEWEAEDLFASNRELEERVTEHCGFLFASMLAGKEGIKWAKNPLYVHLRKAFPDLHEAVRVRLAGPKANPKQAARAGSVSSGTSSLKRKRGRTAKTNSEDVISEASRASTTGSARARGKPAIAKASSKSSSASQASEPPHHIHKGSTAPQNIEDSEADELALATPVQDSEDERPSRAHKGKSALRPKGSKAAKGTLQSGGKAPATSNSSDEEDGKPPRSSPLPMKRKREEPDHPKRHTSSRHRTHHIDEAIDIPSSPSTTTGNTTPLSPPATDAPLLSSLSAVNHTASQTQDDVWLCALDGCAHKVYLASQPASQKLIREHYALHAYDDDERVRMVKRLQAPSLPIGRLMEKVRLQAKHDGFPDSRAAALGPGGDRFPGLTATMGRAVVQRY